MYRYHNNLLAPVVFNLVLTNSQIHGHSTRTANNYRLHHCRTNQKKKKTTILYQGLKIWNSLPVTILVYQVCQEKSARRFSKNNYLLAKPCTIALSM